MGGKSGAAIARLDRNRRDRHGTALEKLDCDVVDDRQETLGLLVEPLAQRRFGRNLAQAERFRKKAIATHVLDRDEIAFAGGEQADIAADAIGVRHAVMQRDGGQALREARALRQGAADEREAGMGGEGRPG